MVHDLWFKRWAKLYVEFYIDKEKGPASAKMWALNTIKDSVLITQLVPYIKEEFSKRGYKTR